MGDRMKIICFISLWILTVFFFNINPISCLVTNVKITGPNTTNEEASVTLICSANCNNGSCQYTWTPQESGDRYTFDTIKRTDAGKYTCTVSDKNNIPMSSTHAITVNYGPDDASLNDSNTKSVEEGSLYGIICSCGACYPGCSAEWRYGSEQAVISSGVLSFVDVSRSHHGRYICTCTNNGVPSKTATQHFDLDILYPPDVTVTWNENDKRLTCVASGNPAKYTFTKWKHEVGQTLVRELLGHFDGSNTRTLLLGNKTYMDNGIYTCGVENGKMGKADSLVQTRKRDVVISDGPVLVKLQAQHNVSKGSSVTIFVEIYAEPSVSESGVSIKHTNTTIDIEGVNVVTSFLPVDVPFYTKIVTVNGKRFDILISEVKEEYFGELIVGIRNTAGNIAEIVTLTPQGPPDTPTNITYTANVGSVLFKLKPGFYNGANQTFYVEYSTDKNATNWNNDTHVDAGFRKAPDYFKEVTVEGLQAETTYYFRLKGINIYGESKSTETMEVKTLEEPLNVGAIVGGVVAGVAVVILIVVFVICIVKRRTGTKDRKLQQQIPLPSILDNSTSDQAPIIGRSPYVNLHIGKTNSVVYENVKQEVKDTVNDATKGHTEPVYGNTIIEYEENQESHYQNYNGPKIQTKEGSSSNLNRQEPSEEYYNQNDVRQETIKSDNIVPDKDGSAGIPGHETYLDMEMKPEVKEAEVKEYINVEGFKKPKPPKLKDM